MKVRFGSRSLERLFTEAKFSDGFHPQVVRVFRQRVQFLIHATDERDLRAMKSLHYEKLTGKRNHQRSIRVNKQMRVVFEIDGKGKDRTLTIVALEDYH